MNKLLTLILFLLFCFIGQSQDSNEQVKSAEIGLNSDLTYQMMEPNQQVTGWVMDLERRVAALASR